jgi:hypothetical protein
MKPAVVGETVLLVFVISVILVFSLLFFTKRMGRKKWTMLIVLVLLVSFIFAYISISNVWTPATTSYTVRAGERSGSFPWSKLSYPMSMTVEHYFNQENRGINSGDVFFNILLAWTRIATVSGQFAYWSVYGETRLSYSLDSPFFTASTFYAFIIAVFTTLNFVGGVLGFVLANILSRRVGGFRREKA